jgi:hypothetical protein
MNTLIRLFAIATLLPLVPHVPDAAISVQDAAAKGTETTALIETTDGRQLRGALAGDESKGFRFIPAASGTAVPLENLRRVNFQTSGPSPSSASPPFLFELGFGGRISGRLGSSSDDSIRWEDGTDGRVVRLLRAGVRAIDQRPGEAQVLQEGFETIDEARWSQVGLPETVSELKTEQARSLRLPAGGAAVTHRLVEPLGSGRLELAFHDSGARAAGQRWFVDLAFRGSSGLEPVQAVLGWDEDTYAVLSRSGPALAVQRLTRKPGWHRLTLQFGPQRTDLSIDGDELAHGDGPGGPLVEVRFATESVGASVPPADLAVHLDDLRLARFAEPSTKQEVDPSQDEARLTTGDQLFGKIVSLDSQRITIEVAGKPTNLRWAQVAGVRFRRQIAQAQPLAGLWIAVDWRAAAGHDSRDVDHLEGVLRKITDAFVTVDAPFVGPFDIPRDRLIGLTVLGRGKRIVIDANAHHLGNRRDDELDPPQPEGGVLEIPFDLADVPKEPAAFALEVVQVIGESGNLDYSERVKKGELRTRALLNGRPFDDLNRHITTRNETPQRIRLPIPAGILRPGRNVLRLEQSGTKDDPLKLDNMGVLGVDLEFNAAAP